MAYYNGKKVLSVVKVVGKPKEFIQLNDGRIKVLDDAKVTAVFTSPRHSRTSGGVRLYKRHFWGTKKANEISKVTNNVHDCDMATFLANIFGIDPQSMFTTTAEEMHTTLASIDKAFPKEYGDGIINPENDFYDPDFKKRKFYYFYSSDFLHNPPFDKNQFSLKTETYLFDQLILKAQERDNNEMNARFMVKFVKDYEINEVSKGQPYWIGQMSDYWLEVQIRARRLEDLLQHDDPAEYFINVYPRKF